MLLRIEAGLHHIQAATAFAKSLGPNSFKEKMTADFSCCVSVANSGAGARHSLFNCSAYLIASTSSSPKNRMDRTPGLFNFLGNRTIQHFLPFFRTRLGLIFMGKFW
jgi:hypothetical protein